jgi:hypothetical protein
VTRLTSVQEQLAQRLGGKVLVTYGHSEIIVSKIEARMDCGKYSIRAIIEVCMRRLFGGCSIWRVSLAKGATFSTPHGTTAQFRIQVAGIPVFGRKIVVNQLPHGIATEVTLPKGWWWMIEPKDQAVPKEMACDVALREEQARQPEIRDFKTQFVETVLWPEEPPGRVAHQIQVRSERGRSASCFVDATAGTVISRRQAIRP